MFTVYTNFIVVFRAIAGFPGYKVGSNGTVWSCLKVVMIQGEHGRIIGVTTITTDEWKQLKPVPNKGYLRVALCKNGTSVRRWNVHILVLEAFVGPCPPGYECRHKDRDRTNNALSNICWGTRSEQEEDKLLHQTNPAGSRNPNHALTEADIPVIRARIAAGEKQTVIAKSYGVTPQAINKINRGTGWIHI